MVHLFEVVGQQLGWVQMSSLMVLLGITYSWWCTLINFLKKMVFRCYEAGTDSHSAIAWEFIVYSAKACILVYFRNVGHLST